MMRRRKNNALGIFVFASMASTAAIACTHDFDAYQAGGDGVTTSPDGSPEGSTTTGADGSTSSSGDSSTPPTDAAIVDAGADAACATAPMCAATETTCKSACDATLTSCNAMCGGGGGNNGCKFKCKSDRDKCASNCTSTCRTCAGAACTAACN